MKIEFADALPISSEVAHIQQLLQTHQVIIVAGETGSGKSTQLPKICLAAGRVSEAGSIIRNPGAWRRAL